MVLIAGIVNILSILGCYKSVCRDYVRTNLWRITRSLSEYEFTRDEVQISFKFRKQLYELGLPLRLKSGVRHYAVSELMKLILRKNNFSQMVLGLFLLEVLIRRLKVLSHIVRAVLIVG